MVERNMEKNWKLQENLSQQKRWGNRHRKFPFIFTMFQWRSDNYTLDARTRRRLLVIFLGILSRSDIYNKPPAAAPKQMNGLSPWYGKGHAWIHALLSCVLFPIFFSLSLFNRWNTGDDARINVVGIVASLESITSERESNQNRYIH